MGSTCFPYFFRREHVYNKDKLKFINVNTSYLKAMHNACSEVFYSTKGYGNKPHIGMLISEHNLEYVIPLSSAKRKHKSWKNVDGERYLIYEKTSVANLSPDDIWVQGEEKSNVKHIISVLDIKKMFPVIDGVYTIVNLNYDNNDTEELKKYKDLLNKEYSFCLKIIDKVISKANKLYSKQMSTGKILKYCCDFKALEKASITYSENSMPDSGEDDYNC